MPNPKITQSDKEIRGDFDGKKGKKEKENVKKIKKQGSLLTYSIFRP